MKNIATPPAEIRPWAFRMGRLHAAVASAMTELVDELASFDADEVWRDDGATDVVSWLTYELGLLPRTARAWVDVARALMELPELRRRLESGELSFDQVRALCRIATPDDELELAEMATDMTAAQIERMVRKAKEIPKEDVAAQEPERVLTWWWESDDRFMHLEGKLPAAEGALVEKALLRIASQDRDWPAEWGFRPMAERAADSLALMASEALARDGDADRATVVVHVSADALAAAQGVAVIEDGPVIAVETARRLACDSRWLLVADGPNGAPLGVGRTSRRIPAWLTRMIRERDEGCRFPGCGRTRWTHAHHIEHWSNGGPTNIDNLITMCGYHHRRIHDEGWAIRGDPNGEVEWVTPHGWTMQPARVLPARERWEKFRIAEIDALYLDRRARIAAPT
jgi:hypothetical protein